MKRLLSPAIRRTIQKRWKEFALKGGIIAAVLFVVVQLAYPTERLLPFLTVEKQSVGGLTRADAVSKLNRLYAEQHISVHIGEDKQAKVAPKLSELGMRTQNTDRLSQLNYPFYLRLVPTSLLWAHLLQRPGNTTVVASNDTDVYIDQHLIPLCNVKPRDASLKIENNKLVLAPSNNGGECDRAKVVETIKLLQPNLANSTSDVRISLKELPPAVSNATAEKLRDKLMARLQQSVPFVVRDGQVQIPVDQLITWMDFSSKENDLVMTLSAEKAGNYLAKNITPKVAVAPGVTHITTQDFTEISRVEGATGQTLDVAKTLRSIESYIMSQTDSSLAVVTVVPAIQEFTRTYTKTDAGLNALLTNFAKDHRGTFGFSYAELTGGNRRANYEGDKQFVTASTYKLFVAYSVLRRVETGALSWANVEGCFNKMISLSDNACAEDFLLSKTGLQAVTNEIQAMGLKNSTFTKKGGPFTTANDLVVFLGSLEASQSLKGESRARLINAMRGNVHRNGIPAGTSAPVADKVGYMNGLYHDAAIVYSPKGTYVLAIMSEGSSWNTLADLTREIEKIRG